MKFGFASVLCRTFFLAFCVMEAVWGAGSYLFPNLLVGIYDIALEAKGSGHTAECN
jgi:hypothetical protein